MQALCYYTTLLLISQEIYKVHDITLILQVRKLG